MKALLLTYIAVRLWAADPINTAIEKAQNLTLKKNRLEAAQVLNDAITTAAPPLRGRSKLIEAEAGIAKIFFTDKGQKLYESGQSAIFENPEIAMNQFKEALALEDGNVLILNNIARIQIGKQDCASALATLLKARTLYPYAGEPALLELRALACQKNFEVFREKIKNMPPLEKGQDSFVQYLVAQDFLQQKMWAKATEILSKVSEEMPQFPEAYYYLTRAGNEMDRDTDAWGQKYISLCKGIGLRERNKFPLEPRLCAYAKEVEDELAKKTDN